MSVKVTAFWNVDTSNLLEFYRRFGCACCCHPQNSCSKHFLNMGKLLSDHIAQFQHMRILSCKPEGKRKLWKHRLRRFNYIKMNLECNMM